MRKQVKTGHIWELHGEMGGAARIQKLTFFMAGGEEVMKYQMFSSYLDPVRELSCVLTSEGPC